MLSPHPSVSVFTDGHYAYTECTSQLDPGSFDEYRTAVAGTYIRSGRTSRVPIGDIHYVVTRLRTAGFRLDIDSELNAHLQTTAKQWHDFQTTRERIRSIDDELFVTCGRRLFPHQGPGAEWLSTRPRALLADEPGVAKTLQALVALPANAPVLVIAPAGIKGTWLGEIERCRPHLRPTVLSGRDSFRWPGSGEVLIANYEILPPPDSIDAPQPETVLVFDEVHACKNPDAERTIRAMALSLAVQSVPGGRIWGLTGTPIKSGIRDLWHVLETLGLSAEAFGSFGEFDRMSKSRGVEWLDDDEIAKCVQRVALRRTKADVFPDMPDKLFQEEVIPLDAKLLRACEAMAASFGGVEEFSRLLKRGSIRFQDWSRAYSAVATLKTPYLLQMVTDMEEDARADDGGYADPLVVFCAHRAPIDALGARKGWATITGDIKAGPERQRIIDDFQRGKYLGLAATSGAAGEGVTLTRAHRMILVDLSPNPSDNEQVTDRIHRAGQFEKCLYWILKVDHPIDRRITEITLEKMRVNDATIGAAATETGGVSAEEELRLVREEVASGQTVSIAETDERKRLVEQLHTTPFTSRKQERLASVLAEQSLAIGLTERQWNLAARLVSGEPASAVRTNGIDDGEATGYEETLGREAGLSPKVIDLLDRFSALSSEDRIDALIECVEGRMTQEERDQLFAELDALFGDDEDEDEDSEDEEDEEDDDG